MTRAPEFVYEQFGRYVAPGGIYDWALKSVFTNSEGKAVSMRSPAKPTILITQSDVWVQTKSIMPPNDLPSHIHWGAEGLLKKAVAEADNLGSAWFGLQMSNAGPDNYLPTASINFLGADSCRFYVDSGRSYFEWRPSIVKKIVGIFSEAFPGIKPKDIWAVIDGAWEKKKPLTQEQARARKRVLNLLANSQPQALIPSQRRGLSLAIEAVMSNTDITQEES